MLERKQEEERDDRRSFRKSGIGAREGVRDCLKGSEKNSVTRFLQDHAGGLYENQGRCGEGTVRSV